MNNMNFSKNPFNGLNNNTKIAGNHVFKKSDGGRMSLEEVRNNMNEIKHPQTINEVQPQINNMNNDLTKTRIDAYKNIGRHED